MANELSIANLKPLLLLVEDACTGRRVARFLKAAKETHRTIRSSGTKSRLVKTHLRAAVLQSLVPLDSVFRLMSEAEEATSQHILFFVPQSKTTAVPEDVEWIGERLLKSEWNSAAMPRVLAKPSGWEWGDIRADIEDGKQVGWSIKAYKGHDKRTFERKYTRGSREYRVYVWKYHRDIVLIRWHSQARLLQIRVPFCEGRNEFLKEVEGAWNSVSNVIDRNSFKPFDLCNACRAMIADAEQQKATYRIGHARLEDEKGGSTSVAAQTTQSDLMASVKRKQALQIYNDCRELMIYWLLDEVKHDSTEELSSVVGRFLPNNLKINAKTTPEALRHVVETVLAYGT